MKRRITLLRLIPCVLVAICCLTVAPLCARGLSLDVLIGAGSSSAATVHAQSVSGQEYLFLPGQTDLNNIVLSSDSGEIEAWSYATKNYEPINSSVNLTDLGVVDADGNLPSGGAALWVRIGGVESKVLLMKSASIRSVFITTEHDRSYIESSATHSVSDKGRITVFAPESDEPYYDADFDAIKGRGNSTWGGSAKKPYQIKLKKKAELLQNGEKSKTWLLLANAADPTLLRNTISFKLATYLGVVGTPSCEPCDLYYNGEYRGNYLVTEKVKVEKDGVNIDDLDDANAAVNEGSDSLSNPFAHKKWATNKYGQQFSYVEGLNNPDNITGGYLVELDDKAGEELSTFYAGGHYFTIHTPEVATYEEVKYISELFNESFCAAHAGGLDPNSGKLSSDIFDDQTLVATGLAEDFLWDGDYLFSSSYFYVKPNAEVVYLGPIWDCDRAFFRGKETTPSTFAMEFYSGNPELIKQMKEKCDSMLAPLVNEVLLGDEAARTEDGSLHSISYYASQIASSQKMDETIWGIAPLYDPYVAYDRASGKTWEQFVSDLSVFSKKRVNYLSGVYSQDNWKCCTWRGSSVADWVPYVDGAAVYEGWVYDQGSYYLMNSGHLITGWANVAGTWYFLDYSSGAMKTGWVNDGGTWYFCNARGKLQTGWEYLGGNWYFLTDGGAMATGWNNIDGAWYWMGASGAMATGWVCLDGNWYYLQDSGAMATGWAAVDGAWYYLDASGAMRTGWLSDGSGWYWLDGLGSMATGWRLIGGSWYLLGDSGAMATGWSVVDGAWYYLDASGAMRTGWLNDGSGWYWLDGSGVMGTGYIQINGVWYYFDDSGRMTSEGIAPPVAASVEARVQSAA